MSAHDAFLWGAIAGSSPLWLSVLHDLATGPWWRKR